MRSARVTPNTVATPSDYNALINDSSGASVLLAHQMYGTIELPTNPTNNTTLTLDINGTNVVITFVTSLGSTAGNVLIGASNTATAANLLQLLLNPTISNSTQVALGVNTSTAVTLVNYINWSLGPALAFPFAVTSIFVSSYNSILYAPATSFSATTTVTGGSYAASTMTLYVEPGIVYVNGSEIYFAGGITPTVTAPVSHPRIDVLSLSSAGVLSWTTGTEASTPSVPTYPTNKLPICELYNVTGETILNDNANQASAQGYILNDVRPFLQNSVSLGALTDDLLPSADGGQNLGSASFEWNNVYVKSGIFLAGVKFVDKFGGTGSDGALTVTSGTTTISASSAIVLIKNYTSVSITGTAYVQCTSPATAGTAVILKSEGNVTLTSSATPMLDASGMGASGGTGGTSNTANTGAAGNVFFISCGGGTGANGATGGTVGIASQSPNLNLNKYPGAFAGGGGGGGGSNTTGTGGTGGRGGGTLIIECAGAWNFTTTGGISVLGIAGGAQSGTGSPGGTGGSGYFLALYNTLTANSGTVSAGSVAGTTGGTTGNAGAGGAGAGSGSAATSAGAVGGAGSAGVSLITSNVDY